MNPLDWIYPPRCAGCQTLLPLTERAQLHMRLCAACEALFEPLPPPVCARCGHPVEAADTYCSSCRGKAFAFEHNRALFAYTELTRAMMHEMKFRGRRRVAECFGALWATRADLCDFHDADFLIPVPMNRRKVRERGFNPTWIMARALSARFCMPVLNDALLRVRDTPAQSGLNARQRAENMQDAFRLHPRRDITHKRICLIDDIYTTGATLNACADTLRKSGAASVVCFTFSISVKS